VNEKGKRKRAWGIVTYRNLRDRALSSRYTIRHEEKKTSSSSISMKKGKGDECSPWPKDQERQAEKIKG